MAANYPRVAARRGNPGLTYPKPFGLLLMRISFAAEKIRVIAKIRKTHDPIG